MRKYHKISKWRFLYTFGNIANIGKKRQESPQFWKAKSHIFAVSLKNAGGEGTKHTKNSTGNTENEWDEYVDVHPEFPTDISLTDTFRYNHGNRS